MCDPVFPDGDIRLEGCASEPVENRPSANDEIRGHRVQD